MFSGDEQATIEPSGRTRDQLYDAVEDALNDLGDCRIGNRGEIDIRPRSGLTGPLSQAWITGDIRERKDGTHTVTVEYSIGVGVVAWVLTAIWFVFSLLSALFCLPCGIGILACPLVFLAPVFAKDRVSRAVRLAVRSIE